MVNKFSAVDQFGTIHRRNSKSRTYLFTVVAKPDFRFELDEAQMLSKQDASNYRFAQAILIAGVGNKYTFPGTGRISHYPVTQQEFDRAVDVAGNGKSCEDYQRECARGRIAKVTELEQQGRYRTWVNMGWCGRRDLAERLAQQTRQNKRYCEVQILNAMKQA